MARGRRKRRTNLYSTDLNRLSVYPRYQAPRPGQERKRFAPGDQIKVRVTGLDDDGRPTGVVLGYTVVVVDATAEPGEELRAIVERVEGRTVYARVSPGQ